MRIDIEEEHIYTGACTRAAACTHLLTRWRPPTPPRGAAHRPSGDLTGDLPVGFRLPEGRTNLPAFRLPWQLSSWLPLHHGPPTATMRARVLQPPHSPGIPPWKQTDRRYAKRRRGRSTRPRARAALVV